jgi:hypothetical protein
MKKKIAVISLILLFFVSTVGLPLSINLCSMMDTPQAESCEMNSKCENEAHSVSLKVEFTKTDCCTTQIVDKSISDKYLQVDIQKCSLNQNVIALINLDLIGNNNSPINSIKYFNDSSPPQLISNNIYLDNSILLI